jgi:DNA polymerase
MLDRALLVRYLRQRAELGERELFLEGCSAEELLAMLGSGPRPADTATRRHGDTATLDSSARVALIREALAAPGAVAPAASRAATPEAAPSPRPRVAVSADTAQAPSGQSPLQVLAAEAAQCTACRLSQGRRSVVFGEGDPAARLVVVGEAPGQEEDRTGRPFVGQAGKLLDLLLMSVGLPRESVYICNTLKCRPPQNRNPLPDELAACSGFLQGQLSAIAPGVLLAVGKFPAQSLVGSEESISRLRGRLFRYRGIPLVVTYHPAFLLRSPQWITTAWEDFQLARKVLDEQA